MIVQSGQTEAEKQRRLEQAEQRRQRRNRKRLQAVAAGGIKVKKG